MGYRTSLCVAALVVLAKRREGFARASDKRLDCPIAPLSGRNFLIMPLPARPACMLGS